MVTVGPSEEDVTIELGRRLRFARRRAGVSQEVLARAVGVHRTTVGLIENGKREMEATTCILLIRALDIDIEEVFGGIEFVASQM